MNLPSHAPAFIPPGATRQQEEQSSKGFEELLHGRADPASGITGSGVPCSANADLRYGFITHFEAVATKKSDKPAVTFIASHSLSSIHHFLGF